MFYRGVFVPPGLEHLLDTLKEKVQHLQHCNSSSCDSTKHQSSNDKPVNAAKLEYKKKKKQRQKKIKRHKMKEQRNSRQEGTKDITVIAETDSNDKVPDQEIEYVQEIPSVGDLEPTYKQFVKVFETFKLVNPKKHNQEVGEAISLIDEYDDDLPLHLQHHQTTDENGLPKLSKKKLKKLSRLTVAELKQLVGRSDVVEIHDITARDPKLLVQLKAHRNTVPVPRHWCFKKKYLQGKRGIEKPPYDLPAFIKQTGITEMRACLEEEEEDKSLKTKMRERTRPKLGKIDIDYQVLHDAFFKWQTKPRLTVHGEIYYEGKKYETRFKEKRPGALTDELRIALGMPIGLNCHKVPPPWLTAMQRYGPPPSYPNLKIPGLNTPIPEGCTFGYHAGGWGKPPVDDTGQPLYGDVFGTSRDLEADALDKEVDRRRWGEPESESSEEEENDKDKEEDNAGKEDATGLVTPDAEGSSSPSGITSIPPGIETPENVEFRKRKIEREMESTDNPALYTVLPERRREGFGSSMMGSTHVYDMTGSGGLIPPSVIAARRGAVSTAEVRATEKEGAVEIALDPSELNLDSETIANRYEEAVRNRQALHRENLSDMVENHVQKQKSKRKRQLDKDTKRTKIYKEFKF